MGWCLFPGVFFHTNTVPYCEWCVNCKLTTLCCHTGEQVFKCSSGSNCKFKKSYKVPKGTASVRVTIHAKAEYHHGGDFSLWGVGQVNLRCDGGNAGNGWGGVNQMCTKGRNCRPPVVHATRTFLATLFCQRCV